MNMMADKARLLALDLPRRIIAALASIGVEGRYCGGVVRDMILGQLSPSYPDIDMASPLPADEAMVLLKSHGLRVIPTGLSHGTITVCDPQEPRNKVELTTLRVDVATDGRHAEVSFTDDWLADASRRDFTINSLYLTPSGEVIDHHHGLEDIQSGVIRFIGDPYDRLSEDYLRVLRYFRFFARFGQLLPDEKTSAALTAAASRLASLSGASLSGERVAQEMRKILASGSVAALTLMNRLKVLEAMCPADWDLAGYETWAQCDNQRDPMLALAVLLPEQETQTLAQRWKLSRKEQQKLKRFGSPLSLPQYHILTGQYWQQEAWRLCQRKGWSGDDVAGAVMTNKLKQKLEGATITVDHLEMIRGYNAPVMPVNGDDIRSCGIDDGKVIGQELTAIEEVWLNSHFSADRASLLAEIKARYRKHQKKDQPR
jgi:poly(A) polymerase